MNFNSVPSISNSDFNFSRMTSWLTQSKALAKSKYTTSVLILSLIDSERQSIYPTIRPHLEYCVQLWNPPAAHGSWGTVLEMESVQRRFTRLIDEVGTLPYSRSLEILNLTTLAERRIRGDLIEAFKVTSGLTDNGSGMFRVSRSGLNLVSSNRCSRNSTKIKNIQKSFLPERVIPYWNKLPPDVKNSVTVLSFKIKLEGFKKDMNSKSITNDCFFWNVSYEVLARIEGVSYISNKEKHNDYLWFHPYVAKKRFINLYSTGKFD